MSDGGHDLLIERGLPDQSSQDKTFCAIQRECWEDRDTAKVEHAEFQQLPGHLPSQSEPVNVPGYNNASTQLPGCKVRMRDRSPSHR